MSQVSTTDRDTITHAYGEQLVGLFDTLCKNLTAENVSTDGPRHDPEEQFRCGLALIRDARDIALRVLGEKHLSEDQ